MKLCTGDLLKISAFAAFFCSTGLSALRWGAKFKWDFRCAQISLFPLRPAKMVPHILGKMLDCMQTDIAAASKLRTVEASVA